MSGLTSLAKQWTVYPKSMSTSDKLFAINAMMAPGPAQDVSRARIKEILESSGALTHMQAYVTRPTATQPCLTATNYLLALVLYEATVDDTLRTSDPASLGMIQELAPNLLADPSNGMSPKILGEIMALITPDIPWWQANGFPGPILVSDLIAAGNLF